MAQSFFAYYWKKNSICTMSPLKIQLVLLHSNYSIDEFKIHKIDTMRKLLAMLLNSRVLVITRKLIQFYTHCKQTSHNNCFVYQIGNLLPLLSLSLSDGIQWKFIIIIIPTCETRMYAVCTFKYTIQMKIGKQFFFCCSHFRYIWNR